MIPPLDYRLGWRCPLTGCYVGTGVGLGCAGCFQNCGLNGEDTMNTYCKAGLELSSDGTPPFAGYDKGQPIHADGSACFHGLRDWNGQERRGVNRRVAKDHWVPSTASSLPVGYRRRQPLDHRQQAQDPRCGTCGDPITCVDLPNAHESWWPMRRPLDKRYLADRADPPGPVTGLPKCKIELPCMACGALSQRLPYVGGDDDPYRMHSDDGSLADEECRRPLDNLKQLG